MAKKYPLSGGSGMRAGFPRTDISAMDDVIVDNPRPGQGLVWNGANWENAVIPGGGSSNIVYYPVNLAGSVPPLKLLDTKPNNAIEADLAASVKAATSPVLIQEFITGELGKTRLQGGIWNLTYYVKADIITGNTVLRTFITIVDTTGAWKADIVGIDTEPIDAVTLHPLNVSIARGEYALLITDKIKIAIYAVSDNAADVLVTMPYSDFNYVSRMETPFIINHADIPGLDYSVDGHTGHITKAANQFASIAAKAAPIRADQMIIEDSADALKKKSVNVGDLAPWLYGTGAPPATTGLVDGTLYIKYVP